MPAAYDKCLYQWKGIRACKAHQNQLIANLQNFHQLNTHSVAAGKSAAMLATVFKTFDQPTMVSSD
jgi:hypothetical protein